MQHVYIKTLKLRDDALLVTSEAGKAYRVDLKTKKVTPAEQS